MSVTFLITCGVAGSGKTYVRGARFVVDHYLRDNPDGVYISNLPLAVDVIADHVGKRDNRDPEDVRYQLELIPQQELNRWQQEESGPWQYFAGRRLAGCHLAIDEAHKYCGTKHGKDHIRRWQEWIGEARHLGITVEFITQAESKLPRELRDEAGMLYFLENREYRRDPFFGILYSDWAELKASITRQYEASFNIYEVRDVGGLKKLNEDGKRVVDRDPFYFQFYDSFNAPTQESVGAGGKLHEFQRRTVSGVWLWFVRRNLLRLIINKPVGVGCLLLAMITGVGQTMFEYMLKTATGQVNLVSSDSQSPKPDPTPHRQPQMWATEGSGFRGERLAERIFNDEEQRIEAKRKDWKAVTNDAIILVSAGRIAAGEVVPIGPHSGLTLVRVDSGRVHWSDGTSVCPFPASGRDPVPRPVSGIVSSSRLHRSGPTPAVLPGVHNYHGAVATGRIAPRDPVTDRADSELRSEPVRTADDSFLLWDTFRFGDLTNSPSTER